MAVKRLPRNTRVDPISLGIIVERANRDRFAQIARNANMTSSAMFDSLVVNMPLDEAGRPVWLPFPAQEEDSELPI